MIFRRRRDRHDAPSGAENQEETDSAPPAGSGGSESPAATTSDRPRGPWDAAELDRAEDDPTYVDLGGLVVKGRLGLELRLNSDPQSGQPVAVMLAAQDGALELRAFAAPRSGGVWDGVRADIAAEVTRLGGSVEERDGEYGPELVVSLQVALDDGRRATQPSRIVGVTGPRWLLRGTFLGRPAVQPEPDGLLESALRDVIVVRGSDPMSPREALPLRLPSDVQPWSEPPA